MADINSTLSQEYLNSIFEYKDGIIYWKKNTAYQSKVGQKIGTKSHQNGYLRVQLHKKQYFVHRIIFTMFYGFIPTEVDHIDGNPGNNKIENLRNVSRTQNCINTRLRTTNKSGFKNVSWSKTMKKWSVQIRINKKNIYFGWYDDIELADLVAQEARNKHHKQFARDI
jgi:hypothetical protein